MELPLEDTGYFPLSEIVYRKIRRAIVEGEYPPGSMLSEKDLSRRLQVSATPVREALFRLAYEGLVIRIPHKGNLVTPITFEELEEVYQLRIHLEGLAARYAAERADAETRRELEEALNQLVRFTRIRDKQKIGETNVRIHQLIWRASQTKRIPQILSSLQDYVSLSRLTVLQRPSGPEVLLEEHARIVRAILDGDPDEAERAMRDHISHTLRELKAQHHL